MKNSNICYSNAHNQTNFSRMKLIASHIFIRFLVVKCVAIRMGYSHSDYYHGWWNQCETIILIWYWYFNKSISKSNRDELNGIGIRYAGIPWQTCYDVDTHTQYDFRFANLISAQHGHATTLYTGACVTSNMERKFITYCVILYYC